MGDEEEVMDVRIQFINDLDPFVSTSDRQPMLPLKYSLVLSQAIGEQMPDIIRKLRAPHKPGDAQLQVSPSATGDLGSYLDSDLSILEQPDELDVLRGDM
ncbi:unnamed protein product [Bursaphelenchus xylophilus]|nr:unnamed protein product [Bursaphelenchus xylophilus]CAG9090019.1 unnamed protein product [Bursaphelenchus xylophilus]